MELQPYSESRRDRVELDLARSANRPEIYYERRHGLDIHVYYIRKLGTVLMSLVEGEGENLVRREFPIPNDRVNDAIAHPEAYSAIASLSSEPPTHWNEGPDGA